MAVDKSAQHSVDPSPVFPNLEEPLKLFFISRENPTYENVCRPEKLIVGSLIQLLINY
jgi:hypothetical protein